MFYYLEGKLTGGGTFGGLVFSLLGVVCIFEGGDVERGRLWCFVWGCRVGLGLV